MRRYLDFEYEHEYEHDFNFDYHDYCEWLRRYSIVVSRQTTLTDRRRLASMLSRIQTVPGCSACVIECSSDDCSQLALDTECTEECRVVSCIESSVPGDCDSCPEECVLTVECEDVSNCGEIVRSLAYIRIFCLTLVLAWLLSRPCWSIYLGPVLAALERFRKFVQPPRNENVWSDDCGS